MRLDWYVRGMVRDVSPLVGAWLIMEGYAVPEWRRTREDDQQFGRVTPFEAPAEPRPRRSGRRSVD